MKVIDLCSKTVESVVSIDDMVSSIARFSEYSQGKVFEASLEEVLAILAESVKSLRDELVRQRTGDESKCSSQAQLQAASSAQNEPVFQERFFCYGLYSLVKKFETTRRRISKT